MRARRKTRDCGLTQRAEGPGGEAHGHEPRPKHPATDSPVAPSVVKWRIVKRNRDGDATVNPAASRPVAISAASLATRCLPIRASGQPVGSEIPAAQRTRNRRCEVKRLGTRSYWAHQHPDNVSPCGNVRAGDSIHPRFAARKNRKQGKIQIGRGKTRPPDREEGRPRLFRRRDRVSHCRSGVPTPAAAQPHAKQGAQARRAGAESRRLFFHGRHMTLNGWRANWACTDKSRGGIGWIRRYKAASRERLYQRFLPPWQRHLGQEGPCKNGSQESCCDRLRPKLLRGEEAAAKASTCCGCQGSPPKTANDLVTLRQMSVDNG